MAFNIQQNGILLGIFLIMLGGWITYYSAMLIVIVANKTKCSRFEDIALSLYGSESNCKTLMSVLNLTCLMGYIIAYIVYMKTMIPTLLLLFWTEDQMPDFLNGSWG